MPASKPGYPPVATLRRLVAEKVESTSIRVVAKEIGMSSSGLHSLLYAGKGTVHPRTYAKLARWYQADRVSRKGEASTPVTPELTQAAASLILQGLDATQRQLVLTRLADAIVEATGDPAAKRAKQLRKLAKDETKR